MFRAEQREGVPYFTSALDVGEAPRAKRRHQTRGASRPAAVLAPCSVATERRSSWTAREPTGPLERGLPSPIVHSVPRRIPDLLTCPPIRSYEACPLSVRSSVG